MDQNFAKLAFSSSVKKVQEEFSSRKHYSRLDESGDRFVLSPNEISFIEDKNSFYLSSVGEESWPYIQHRGGPKGFLKVINNTSLAMADFSGNAQYISTGNIISNNKTMLFLMDYPTKSRLKIWATSKIVKADENPELLASLEDKEYGARIERIIVFTIKAFDWNCNQHITQRFTRDEFEMLMLKQTF